MKKRILVLILALSMALSMAACGGGGKASPASSTAPEPAGGGEEVVENDLPGLQAGMLEAPAMLTSVGQSADVSIVNTLFGKAEIEVSMDNVITADELDTAKYKTLVLAVGGSSKGLGAAGIDENSEVARVEALIQAAEKAGMKILTIHIGGSARRGTLSDKFLPAAFQAADAAIVLSEGDTDDAMRGILAGNNTPSQYVEQQIDSIEPIKTLFGK